MDSPWATCEAFFLALFRNLPLLIGLIILVYIVSYLLRGIYFIMENKAKINANWATYRCQPQVMPFAGWFIGPGNTNPASNFTQCMYSNQKSFYDVLKQDFVQMFGSLSNIVKDQQDAIQDVRNMTNYMRQSALKLAQDVYQRIYDAYYRISAIFGVFLGAIGSMVNMFRGIFNVLLYSFYTFMSLYDGPIGKIAKFMCFAEGTVLRGGRTIEKLRVGDRLPGGVTVDGIFEILHSAGDNFYDYLGVGVSGEHLVLENNEWVKVSESLLGLPFPYAGKRIYCINTSDHRIVTVNGTVFTDFMEKPIEEYAEEQEALIGEPPAGPMYHWGVAKGAMIGGVPIERVPLGRGVVARVELSGKGVEMYELSGIVLSGTCLVQVKGEDGTKWQEVRSHPLARPAPPVDRIYHLETIGHQIRFDWGLVIRDYDERELP